MAKSTKSRKKSSSNIFELIRKESGLKSFGPKQARAAAKKLVKKGVLSARTDTQNLSKYALSKIRKFYSVVQDKATSLAINPGEKQAYKEAGYTVVNGHAIIPRRKGQTIKRVRPVNGAPSFQVQTRDKYGQVRMESTEILAQTLDLDEFLRELRAKGMTLKKGESIGFRFYGFNSRGLYSTFEGALDYFETYPAVYKALNTRSNEEMQEIIQNIQFVRVKKAKEREWFQIASNQHYSPEAYERKYGRRKYKNTGQAKDARAETRRRQREEMTPEQKTVYKAKAKARAAKSRAKNKAK